MKLLVCTLLLSTAALAWQKDEVKLPPPDLNHSVRNNPRVIARPDGAQLQLPAGFNIEEYLTDFKVPRFMLLGPNKELLISEAARNGKGWVGVVKGKERKKLIENLTRPYGLALWKEYLYVGEPTSIKRYKYDSKAMTAGAGEEIIAYGKDYGQGHWTRSLLFDRKGEKLYVGVGSRSNVDAGEAEDRAAINRYNPDGTGHEILASGTRNPIGLHWLPGTDTLWAAVQERDLIGDDLVPDYFTHIQQGAFYGWPDAYAGPNPDPRRTEHPERVAKTIRGDVLLPAHAAVLDYTFYTGKMFPKQYQGGAFLAWHGSWDRAERLGYPVAFVPFADGQLACKATEFLKGW